MPDDLADSMTQLTLADIEDIRCENFADDMDILPEMTAWGRKRVTAYFETAGESEKIVATAADPGKAAVLARIAGVAPLVDVTDSSEPAAPAPKPTAAVGQYRWLVDISEWEPGPAEWQLLLKQLPAEDSTKVMKFKFVADQKRALVSRFLQRRACHEATGVPWKAVEIVRTKGGKPFMNNKPKAAGSGLHANWNFNVSHEGKYVALAAEPRLVCGVDVAAPEEARAGAKARELDDTLEMMKGQMAPQEWAVIQAARPNQHRMEECFRKFWSLKEAYTKGRGDGLGFEFNRTDFLLGAMEDGAGLVGQKVQRAGVTVDRKKLPSWGFYIQPLEADHWVSTARGPPSDIVDAHGAFTKTFGEVRPPPAAITEQLALPEPPFAIKTIADLVADEAKSELAKARSA